MENTRDNKMKLQLIVESITQDPSVDKETKAKLIIHATSLVCAIVAAQPIPFADIAVLTPIQLVMVTALNKIMGNPFEKSSIKEIVISLSGVVGWGTLAQHTILGLYKTVLPFMGGLTTIPLVYAATFGLGIGAKYMIEAKKNDQNISDAELKKAIEKAKQEAKVSQQKLTMAESLEQINALLKDADVYAEYKDNLLALERNIRELYNNEVSMDTDVNNLILKRKQIILARLNEKYQSVKINDYVLSALSIIDSKLFIEKAEPAISQICFKMAKLNCVASRSFGKGKIFEIETDFGSLLVKQQKEKEIILIDFNDDIKENSLLSYMSFNKTGTTQIKKDGEIGECFRDIIKNAKDYVYIVSPWVSHKPFDATQKAMKEALKKNPDINFKILYGYKDKDPNSSKDERITTSRKYIKEYEKEFGSTLESKETNTHVKLVIADDKCFLIGSMNFLSFLGDYRYVKEDGLRHEVVMLSHDKEMLQELKEAYFNW